MTTTTKNFGTNTAPTVTNLQSLADGSHWQGGKIDSASALSCEVMATIVTTTSSGDSDGYIEFFYAGSTDGGTNFAGQATGTEGSYSNTLNLDIEDTRKVYTMKCDASETTARTYIAYFTIDDPAEDFVILAGNQSGQSLASSGNKIEYRLNKYDSA